MLESFNEKEEIQSYVQLLQANKNLILTGAPGTGKTYLAKQIAKAMGATSEEQCKMVQFHPSYDYTDFVEGLRPVKSNASDQIGFELRQGVFKQFCEKALENWVDSRKNRKRYRPSGYSKRRMSVSPMTSETGKSPEMNCRCDPKMWP